MENIIQEPTLSDVTLKEQPIRKLSTIAMGIQRFNDIINNNYFYVDKTNFIKEWWESGDAVTLITRPRRFGKTLTMSMVECFFSNKYRNKEELFQNLNIWKDAYYQQLQGTYPVINLTFSGVKGSNFNKIRADICQLIKELYDEYSFIMEGTTLTEDDKEFCKRVSKNMDDTDASFSLRKLSKILYHYYNKPVIILLDEYDTPLQEAYTKGYWEEIVEFIASLFNYTFKSNPYLERAIMTGITRVSKESIFSDLNNLKVITTTSDEYATIFGFTEQEVFQALDEYGLSNKKQETKNWYNGFVFGKHSNIYNPWSIINLLDTRKYKNYWINTSENTLIKDLIQKSSHKIKEKVEQLLKGETIQELIDEQIVFNRIDRSPAAIWSLLLASGYLKLVTFDKETTIGGRYNCQLAITNQETMDMFYGMVHDWFSDIDSYSYFLDALLENKVRKMNKFMNKMSLEMFSSFDSGNKPSEKEPERFYHGFVLGLLVELRNRYSITSNRESGYGRYDVMLKPFDKKDNAYIFEFKVLDPDDDEKALEETVQSAIKQIREKQYAVTLKTEGYTNIHTYGFAFKGKEVLIEKGE